MKKVFRSSIILLMIVALTMTILTGCSSKSTSVSSSPDSVSAAVIEDTAEISIASPTANLTAVVTSMPTVVTPMPAVTLTATPDPVSALSEMQRNSINMLNWLAYLTQDINSSSNNRLFIEEVYSLIVNETYPNAVDERTQDRLSGIRQALVRYRMVDIKRDRIEYLYEQNKARAMKAAIPNPLTVMTAVQSGSMARLVSSVVYMAINSVSSYQSATAQAELQYLKDGWELDDEADDVFFSLRSDAFDYMVDICRAYQLPGYMSLNENAVEDFVSWKNNSNIVRRIQFLESNVDTYRAFGSYWLVLADSYYSNGDYEKCLSAIRSYEALSTRIFRRDNEYAKVLPLAIASAENVMEQDAYIAYAESCADTILANVGNEDWSLRYYAAQTYVNLYARTQESDYLWKAYRAVSDNVNYLIDEQLRLNSQYMADVVEEAVPSGSTKDEKKQVEACNKLKKEIRKTELPPVYEPLLLNLELLSALGDQLGIDDAELRRIDSMLHEDDHQLFLINGFERKYSFSETQAKSSVISEAVSFDGKMLKIPASDVTENAGIVVSVTDVNGNVTSFDDWIVSEVSRKDKTNIETFVATYTSKAAEGFDYSVDMDIAISITPHVEYECDGLAIQYKTVDAKPNWYDYIVVWNNDIGFERAE